MADYLAHNGITHGAPHGTVDYTAPASHIAVATQPAPKDLYAETAQAEEHSAVHISLKAEEIGNIGGFPITNALLLSTIVLVVLGSTAITASRKWTKKVPGMFQNLAETCLEALLDLMDTVFGDRAKSEKYVPLIATIFLFVLFSNWFGLLPGVGSFTIESHGAATPLLRAPSADLNFTLALAVITVISVNVLGAFAIGFSAHAGKFLNFKQGPIMFAVGLLELVSEGARMISFSFRLFGNVFAGEVLLTIIAFLLPYFAPLPFLFLEVFVGFVQALIFSMLSIVFISIATTAHDDHAEDDVHTHRAGAHASH